MLGLDCGVGACRAISFGFIFRCHLLSAASPLVWNYREDMELVFGVSYVPSPTCMPLLAMFMVSSLFLGSGHREHVPVLLAGVI